jgi:hypothetical protein
MVHDYEDHFSRETSERSKSVAVCEALVANIAK